MESSGRGAFILFEGVDRCGKTTQANLLAEHLAGKDNDEKAEFIRFPDRTTPIGTMINSYLTNASDMEDHSIHLLFSANRWEAVPSMLSKLESGITLVCDRYCYSGVAFSAAKEGLAMEWCMSSDIGLPAPDCVIFLDLPIEKARERGDFGGERYEKEDMQIKVRSNFFELQCKDKGVIPWHIIDASQTIEEISEQIQEIAEKTKVSAAQAPIGKIWLNLEGTKKVSKNETSNCDDEDPPNKRPKLEN